MGAAAGEVAPPPLAAGRSTTPACYLTETCADREEYIYPAASHVYTYMHE